MRVNVYWNQGVHRSCFSDPSSAPFVSLNVHLGFSRDDTQALYYSIQIYLTEAPFITDSSEWACMCLPFQASHFFSAVSCSMKASVTSVWSSRNMKVCNHSPETTNWAALFHSASFFFFLSVCSDIFVLKVTRLSLGTWLCVCGSYRRRRVTCVSVCESVCLCLYVCVQSALL